jgi:hypothetical protein
MAISRIHPTNRSDIQNTEYMKLDEEEIIKPKIDNMNNSHIVESQAKDLEKDDEMLFKKFNTDKLKKSSNIDEYYNDIDI